jgi:RNA polymerase sigma-70 factor (ECF subfamily)
MAISNEVLVRVLLRDREKLFAYCWSILRDDDLAEEIFQEVSTLAVQKRGTIQNEQHLAGWLRLAARRKALEAIRARKRMPELLDEEVLGLLESEWGAWDAKPSAAWLEALRHCLGKLNGRARELIELRYQQGLKSRQIADRLGRNVQSVYVALTRIHLKLADCVKLRSGAGMQLDVESQP